jgi:VanZ family protein
MLYKKLLKYWLPVIIWMGVIVWTSTGVFSYEHTLSLDHVNMLHELIRKSTYIGIYFVLGLLLFRASVVTLRKNNASGG